MTRWNFLRSQTANNEAAATPVFSPEPGTDWRVRTVIREEEKITDLKLWGFRTAGSSAASPEVLRTVIGWLYHNRVTVEDAHAASEQQRLDELATRATELRTKIDSAHLEQTDLEGRLERERAKLEEKQADLAGVKAGDSSLVEAHGLSDRLAFFISAGALVLLSVYLFLFYVSAIYNAFIFDAGKAAEEGLRTGRELSVTIFNGLAFQKAASLGWMTFAFLASAPSIVVSLGFLIHHFLKQNKRTIVGAIVGVTFLFDFLLAYEIVSQIHSLHVLTGETSQAFSMGVLFKSPEFYIILLAGFVVYIIWGLILQVVLDGIEKFNPARVAIRKLTHAVAAIKGSVNRIEDELRDCNQSIVRLEGELKIVEQQRSPRELHNNQFRRHLDEMMQGWLTYVGQAFPTDGKERQIEAQRVRMEVVTLLTGAP